MVKQMPKFPEYIALRFAAPSRSCIERPTWPNGREMMQRWSDYLDKPRPEPRLFPSLHDAHRCAAAPCDRAPKESWRISATGGYTDPQHVSEGKCEGPFSPYYFDFR